MHGGNGVPLVRRVRVVGLLGAALVALAIGGCGDDEDTAAEEPPVAIADEPAQTFVERVAKLLETTTTKQGCAQIDGINGRSIARFACPADPALRKSMARFEVVGAAEYGTGAVVDYTSGKVKDGAAVLVFVNPDGKWGISRFGVVTKPSTKTSDKASRAGYEKAVDDYLAAVRERDCKAFKAVAFIESDKRQFCKDDAGMDATKGLAKALKANPSAEPEYQGGNSTYGFFTLELQKPKPQNATISVVGSPEDPNEPYTVLDVVPGPTAAQQRRLGQQPDQPETDSGQPATSPSRKADS